MDCRRRGAGRGAAAAASALSVQEAPRAARAAGVQGGRSAPGAGRAHLLLERGLVAPRQRVVGGRQHIEPQVELGRHPAARAGLLPVLCHTLEVACGCRTAQVRCSSRWSSRAVRQDGGESCCGDRCGQAPLIRSSRLKPRLASLLGSGASNTLSKPQPFASSPNELNRTTMSRFGTGYRGGNQVGTLQEAPPPGATRLQLWAITPLCCCAGLGHRPAPADGLGAGPGRRRQPQRRRRRRRREPSLPERRRLPRRRREPQRGRQQVRVADCGVFPGLSTFCASTAALAFAAASPPHYTHHHSYTSPCSPTSTAGNRAAAPAGGRRCRMTCRRSARSGC